MNIIEISCGPLHTLVLTSEGDIYGWGEENSRGQIGTGIFSESQLEPIKINILLNEKFKAISCGACHSLALTEDGRVFSCGFDKFGQSGDGSLADSNQLKQIELNNDVIIVKISCGLCHSLLLTSDGDIYGFGSYDMLQVCNRPTKVNQTIKFCDIASHNCYSFCAALSVNGLYYVWGKYGLNDKVITEPKETDFKSFNDLFIEYLQITYEPIEGKIIQFDDSFIQNKYYENCFDEIEKLGEGSYGEVFKVNYKRLENNFYAVKKIKFNIETEKEMLKELEIYSVIQKINQKNIMRYKSFWIENNFIDRNGLSVNTIVLYFI